MVSILRADLAWVSPGGSHEGRREQSGGLGVAQQGLGAQTGAVILPRGARGAFSQTQGRTASPPGTPSPGTLADAPGALTQHPQQAEGGQRHRWRLHGHGLLLPLPRARRWVRPWGRGSLSGRRAGRGGVGRVVPAQQRARRPCLKLNCQLPPGETTWPRSHGGLAPAASCPRCQAERPGVSGT